jgi:hypothetical protein
MQSVFIAEGAEFLEFHPIRMFSFVFGRTVVTPLAVVAGERNDIPGHILTYLIL